VAVGQDDLGLLVGAPDEAMTLGRRQPGPHLGYTEFAEFPVDGGAPFPLLQLERSQPAADPSVELLEDPRCLDSRKYCFHPIRYVRRSRATV
jgi:hypothetical protein